MRLVVVKRIGPVDAFMRRDHTYSNLVRAVSDAENDVHTVRNVLLGLGDSAYRRKRHELQIAVDAVADRKKELAEYKANDKNQFQYRINEAYKRGAAYEIVKTAPKGGEFWTTDTVQWSELKNLMTRVEKKEYARLHGLADLESVVVEHAGSVPRKEGDALVGDVGFDKTGRVKIRTHIRTQAHKFAGARKFGYSAGYSVGGRYYVVKTDEPDENVVAALQDASWDSGFADLAA